MKVPLAWPLNNRDGSINKDVRRLNVMLEKDGEEVALVKRPGTSNVQYNGLGLGQGLAVLNDVLFGISQDVMQIHTAPPNSGSDVTSFSVGPAPWTARWKAMALAFKGKLYMMSGVGVGVPNPQADIWSTSDGINWALNAGVAPFDIRYGAQACVLGDKMFVMGGQKGAAGAYSNDVWSTTDGTDWVQETAGAPWLPRAFFTVTAFGSGMYLIGGRSAFIAAHDDVWFSPNGRDWARVGGAFTWGSRQSHSTVAFKGRLYIVGGIDIGGVYQNNVYSSIDGQLWVLESAAAFASARAGVGLVAYGDFMYAIDGETAPAASADSIYRSTNTGTGAWNLIASGPGAGYSFPNVVVYLSKVSGSNIRYPTVWYLNGRNGATGSGFDAIGVAPLNTAIFGATNILPPVLGQPYQLESFNTGTRMLVKNQSALYVWDAASLNTVVDKGYPSVTVPGLVVLGGFAFVMDPSGLIYNCAVDNPYYWPALNVIGADFEEDLGVALAKYMNYVVAFGQNTMQLFYDAGLPKGSPLKPYLNANVRIGCANAFTVKRVGNTIVWLSQTAEKHWQVMNLEGLAPKPLSTPYIEKILNLNAFASTTASAWVIDVPGHLCYCLSFNIASTTGFTLVYDFTTGEWYEWRTPADIPLYFAGSCPQASYGANGVNFVQDWITGHVRLMSTSFAADNTGAVQEEFQVYIRTGKVTGGNNRMKAWGRLDVIGDTNSATSFISYTDDDYLTYSPARPVNMGLQRPALFRNGMSRRRAWVYEQVDNIAMRVSHLEVEYNGEKGEGGL